MPDRYLQHTEGGYIATKLSPDAEPAHRSTAWNARRIGARVDQVVKEERTRMRRA